MDQSEELLMPMSPQQIYVVDQIEAYLRDRLREQSKARDMALDVWRISKAVRPPKKENDNE